MVGISETMQTMMSFRGRSQKR